MKKLSYFALGLSIISAFVTLVMAVIYGAGWLVIHRIGPFLLGLGFQQKQVLSLLREDCWLVGFLAVVSVLAVFYGTRLLALLSTWLGQEIIEDFKKKKEKAVATT